MRQFNEIQRFGLDTAGIKNILDAITKIQILTVYPLIYFVTVVSLRENTLILKNTKFKNVIPMYFYCILFNTENIVQ